MSNLTKSDWLEVIRSKEFRQTLRVSKRFFTAQTTLEPFHKIILYLVRVHLVR